MISPTLLAKALAHPKTGIWYNEKTYSFDFFLGRVLVASHRDCQYYRDHKKEIDLLIWRDILEKGGR